MERHENYTIDLIEITTAVTEARMLAERSGFDVLGELLSVAEREVLDLLHRFEERKLLTFN